MIYKKLYGSVLILGASFVATSSTSYSMVANMRQNRNQVRYMAPNSSCNFNSCNYPSQSNFQQGMVSCQNNLIADDCSARFTNALGEFRSTMNQSLNVGGISLSNFSAVISAQTKLIDAMSDVISLLLRAQERQSTKSNEVKNILIMLENVFSQVSPNDVLKSRLNQKNLQYVLSELKDCEISTEEYETAKNSLDKIAALKDLKEEYKDYCAKHGYNQGDLLSKIDQILGELGGD